MFPKPPRLLLLIIINSSNMHLTCFLSCKLDTLILALLPTVVSIALKHKMFIKKNLHEVCKVDAGIMSQRVLWVHIQV